MSDPLTKQVDNLTQQRSDLVSDVSKMRGEKQKVQDELLALAGTKGRFLAEISTAQKEINLLQEKKNLLKTTTEDDVAALQVRKDTLVSEVDILENKIAYMSKLSEDVSKLTEDIETLKSNVDVDKYLARASEDILKRHLVKLEGVVSRLTDSIITKASSVSDLMDERVEKLVTRENKVRSKERELASKKK